jgi:predicted house-cleaning noncanonical NTP pyrophosphatase (MazG superfamily)
MGKSPGAIMIYNKLIRDKIPEIIENNGGKAVIRQLSQEEFVRFLEMKLDEEAGEYHRDKTVEELADILEVLYALAAVHGCTKEELLAAYEKKHEQRGGFEKRLLLIESERGH